MISATLVEICKWCAVDHIEQMDFYPLNVKSGQGLCCCQHVLFVLTRKAQNDVDTDGETTLACAFHCIHKGRNVVPPIY